MDIVADTLDRMHGWVEVESTPGRGTQIRLLIPRRSIIEHAMIFRAADQLSALPMHSVHKVGPRDSREDFSPESQSRTTDADKRRSLVRVHLAQLLGSRSPADSAGKHLLVLDPAGKNVGRERNGRRLALLVDDIVGPQEVVVRPLPWLLRRHRLLSGVTLSASAEIVLLLDCQQLAELAVRRSSAHDPAGLSTR